MLSLALLLLTAAPVDLAERSAAVVPADRALAGGAAALGAFAGAVLGSSMALGMGASLAGTNDAARAVPELAFPPAAAAVGAGAAGAAAGGAGAGWAGGVGALAGAGLATLGIALAMPVAANEGSQQRNARFAAIVLAPAAAAALGAGGAAALFIDAAPAQAGDGERGAE